MPAAAMASGSLAPPAGYSTSQLIFEDNFTTASLDTSKWNPWMGEDTYGRWGDRGALPSPYSAENAGSYQIQYNDPYPYASGSDTSGNHLGGGGGVLQEIATPSGYFSNLGYSWASSAVSSYGKEYLPATGGYLQISAKMPDSRYGAWASLWLMPTAGSDGKEFDLQESGTYGTTGSSTANDILASHWWGGSQTQHTANTGIDLSAGYHTYGVEYVPGKSWTVFLDGQQMFTWTDGVSSNAAYEVIIELEMAGSQAAGWHTVADAANHPGPFELDVNNVQIYSLSSAPAPTAPTPAPTPPPAPSNLALAAASDSGVVGDNTTNVTQPLITGQGQAGDTVALFDGTNKVGSGTVQTNGSWAITTSSLSSGANNLTATEADAAGTTSTASSGLTVTIDTTPPAAVSDSPLAVQSGQTATITSSLLRFDDAVSSHAQETYTIKTGPANGTLLLNGSPTTSFTQADIDNGHVSYRETASGAATDSFAFTLSDAAGNTTGVQTFQVAISGPPPAPPAPPPPAPSSLALAAASDSGVVGDNTTNVTQPLITGQGQAGDTVALFNGTNKVGSGTVQTNGSWAVTTSPLSSGANNLTATEANAAGTTSTASSGLTVTIDTTPPTLVHDLGLTARSGHSSPITSSLLQFEDNVSSSASDTYTILAGPSAGTLMLNGSPTNRFTQADINNFLVSYSETDGRATSDAFTFSVSDAAGNVTAIENFEISIWSGNNGNGNGNGHGHNFTFTAADMSNPASPAGSTATAIDGGTSATGQSGSLSSPLLPPSSAMLLGDPALLQ